MALSMHSEQTFNKTSTALLEAILQSRPLPAGRQVDCAVLALLEEVKHMPVALQVKPSQDKLQGRLLR